MYERKIMGMGRMNIDVNSDGELTLDIGPSEYEKRFLARWTVAAQGGRTVVLAVVVVYKGHKHNVKVLSDGSVAGDGFHANIVLKEIMKLVNGMAPAIPPQEFTPPLDQVVTQIKQAKGLSKDADDDPSVDDTITTVEAIYDEKRDRAQAHHYRIEHSQDEGPTFAPNC